MMTRERREEQARGVRKDNDKRAERGKTSMTRERRQER